MNDDFRRVGGVSMSKDARLLTHAMQKACRVLFSTGVVTIRRAREVLLEESLTLMQGSDVNLDSSTVRVTTLVQHFSGEWVSSDLAFKLIALDAASVEMDVRRGMRLGVEGLLGLLISESPVGAVEDQPGAPGQLDVVKVVEGRPSADDPILAPSDSLLTLAQDVAMERGVSVPAHLLNDAEKLNRFVNETRKLAKVPKDRDALPDSVTPEHDRFCNHADIVKLGEERRRRLIQFFSGNCDYWDALLSGLARWKSEGHLTPSLEAEIVTAVVLFGQRKGVEVKVPSAPKRPEPQSNSSPAPQGNPARGTQASPPVQQQNQKGRESEKPKLPQGVDPRFSEVFLHEGFAKLEEARRVAVTDFFKSKGEDQAGFLDWVGRMTSQRVISQSYRVIILEANRQLLFRNTKSAAGSNSH